MSAQGHLCGSWSGTRKATLPSMMAALISAVLLAISPGASWGQDVSDQGRTLRGLDSLRVDVGRLMPEAVALGLSADTLRWELTSALEQGGIPVQKDAPGTLTIEVRGFLFGGRLTYSVILTVSQPVVLVASGGVFVAQTWLKRTDSEAEQLEFLGQAVGEIRSLLDVFLDDHQRAKESDH
jgi:hypothetical protein